jgi:hypothetical protein
MKKYRVTHVVHSKSHHDLLGGATNGMIRGIGRWGLNCWVLFMGGGGRAVSMFRYSYPFLGVFGVFRQDENRQDNERFRGSKGSINRPFS